MKRIITLLFVLAGLMAHSHAQSDSVIQKIIQIGTAENQTMKHLDVLCNQIGGRPVGSSAYEDAVVWAARQFQAWGMDVFLDEVRASCRV